MIDINSLKFDKTTGLIPCVIQDSLSSRVLMLGYMNQEALLKTMEEKRVTFFSRSKNRLWTKGETSGNFLNLTDMTPDCDQDCLLIKVKPTGPVCHTGSDTCFKETNPSFSLQQLKNIIQDRINNPTPSSYTSKLLKEGINKVAQKVGEEAVELVIESKDENRDLFLNEAADLMYHYLLLLAAKNTELADVTKVLEQRHNSANS
ncbi:MAG TPA: bifunctional phosphoribosyl-AMP cyclohydrolase/phosphoribosyl-ATP diphosphatase HisIE [Cyclobacteriaceae bacterium]|nr:bifunctional phosphoribosyl-AMP cyclohydrolase/phosphoribosyl-ATP diphosphatase HisIE [Cyclobacteriaceae bacterium]